MSGARQKGVFLSEVKLIQKTLDFDAIAPGDVLGTGRQIVDNALLESWRNIYKEPFDGSVPPGLISVLFMRAYSELTRDRPDGNIHVGQVYTLKRLPGVNEALDIEVRCSEKRMHKNRRIVSFSMEMRSVVDHATIATATGTFFWAR